MLLLLFLVQIMSYAFSERNATFEWGFANTSVLLCAISYCDYRKLPRHNFSGYADTFNITKIINNVKHDSHGFIGYRPSDKTIYAVFRGTHSVVNFLDDLNFVTTAYPYCTGCLVHFGFYSAQQAVVSDVIEEISSLVMRFPDYRVVITGHSLGAAVATLTAVEVVQKNLGILPVLLNFGSPRIGNKEFAIYVTELLPPSNRYRVTHMRDAVPHVPTESQGFLHMAGEWYEDDQGLRVRSCRGFEDDSCNDQWYVGTIADHLVYLGVVMGCLWPPDALLEPNTNSDLEAYGDGDESRSGSGWKGGAVANIAGSGASTPMTPLPTANRLLRYS